MLIDGKNLFPMELVGTWFKGYYMDDMGAIYSTKRGSLSRLAGSVTLGTRRYTLGTSSYTSDDLLRRAKNHAQFNEHTRVQPAPRQDIHTAASLGVTLPKDVRHHASTVNEGISKKGYIIGTLNFGVLQFAKTPQFHITESSVKAEVERLARENAGTKFVYFKVVGVAQAQTIAWE